VEIGKRKAKKGKLFAYAFRFPLPLSASAFRFRFLLPLSASSFRFPLPLSAYAFRLCFPFTLLRFPLTLYASISVMFTLLLSTFRFYLNVRRGGKLRSNFLTERE
jgi:hypothetical protein